VYDNERLDSLSQAASATQWGVVASKNNLNFPELQSFGKPRMSTDIAKKHILSL
jgi:hypothetical protein